MVINQQGEIAKSYSKLEILREPFLRRARACSALTKPTLIPPAGHTSQTEYPVPSQTIGAEGVSAFSARLTNTLFPVGTSWFRYQLKDDTVQEGVEAGQATPDTVTDIERRLGIDAVFDKAWDTMKDGKFNDTEDYLRLLSEKQTSGASYLSSPANQEYILKRIAQVRDYMDREENKAEQSHNETRRKMLEEEEVRANNEYKEDSPETLRAKRADLLSQTSGDYDTLQMRNLNLRILDDYLRDQEQNKSRAEQEETKRRSDREDVLLRDELLNRSKSTEEELRQQFISGDIGMQAYQQIKQYRTSASRQYIQEIQKTFMGRLASYMPASDEDDLRVPETITLQDGTVLHPTRDQLESTFSDFAREFSDWYGLKQRDPVADREEIDNKREELANKALRPYGKKLYAEGENPQLLLKSREQVLPNKEERNATWLEQNPKRKDVLIKEYQSAPNDASRMAWMNGALHSDEKKWLLEELEWKKASEAQKKWEEEAKRAIFVESFDNPASGMQTIFREKRSSGILEMVNVPLYHEKIDNHYSWFGGILMQLSNKISPGSMSLVSYNTAYDNGNAQIKLSGIEAEKAFILRSLQQESIPNHADYFGQKEAKDYVTPASMKDIMDGNIPAWRSRSKMLNKAFSELSKEGAIVMDVNTKMYKINPSYDPTNAIRLMLEQEKKGK